MKEKDYHISKNRYHISKKQVSLFKKQASLFKNRHHISKFPLTHILFKNIGITFKNDH